MQESVRKHTKELALFLVHVILHFTSTFRERLVPILISRRTNRGTKVMRRFFVHTYRTHDGVQLKIIHLIDKQIDSRVDQYFLARVSRCERDPISDKIDIYSSISRASAYAVRNQISAHVVRVQDLEEGRTKAIVSSLRF